MRKHATCGAHFLRELIAIQEMEPDHEWPKKLTSLLMRMKSAKEEAIIKNEQHLPVAVIDEFRSEYDLIMSEADEECPPPPEPLVKHRGRRKRGKERSLIERLELLLNSVFMFIENFRVPFDKTRQKGMFAT